VLARSLHPAFQFPGAHQRDVGGFEWHWRIPLATSLSSS
jgi:hypothetical protein